LAEALLSQTTENLDTLVNGSYSRTLVFPQSMTYLTFGIVKESSATFVLTTHSRQPEGGGSNI